MANLVNAERIGHAYGTRVLLDEVSLGLDRGDVVGVVGRNGDGKTTLLRILTGQLRPDRGRVTRTGTVSVGYLEQAEPHPEGATIRHVALHDRPDHTWAADADSRAVVTELLGDLDLDAPVAGLSGGERRRTALARLLLGEHDLLVLDEPTNHLDVEAVDWLARRLRALQARPGARAVAMLVVSHDRWFLDAICSRIWEVHDGAVDGYDGGYAAYTLARAERARQAAGIESRRQNLLRKELAWLRRGPPARTSKPQFRIDAANALIADEPPPRDGLALQRFAVSRLGKDVFDLHGVRVAHGERVLLDGLDWSIGPGERIGLVGVNGAGKTTLLRLLTGEQEPDAGTVKPGRTVELGYLSQTVTELPDERVLDSVAGLRQRTRLANGRDVSASSLLEEFGFTGDKLTTRTGSLSGGERRRLQLLRLLLEEPNVLLLDEPTNDLDIDTLTVVEDFLDGWPGTLLVVSHDRWFLERVCDVTYALLGDGRCVLLPGGVEEYLERRRSMGSGSVAPSTAAPSRSGAAESRALGKEVAAVERRMTRLTDQLADLDRRLAEHDPADYPGLVALGQQVQDARDELAAQEDRWLELQV